MVSVAEIVRFLQEHAPLELAEDWDNVGLLVGDSQRTVSGVITCLTLTPDVADEVIERGAQLVVTHHPILFRPVQQITTAMPEGRMLLRLIEAGVAVYSGHTAYDSAGAGINQQLAELFELTQIRALRGVGSEGNHQSDPRSPGAGRFGTLPAPLTLEALLRRIRERLPVEHLQYVGDPALQVQKLAIACGSAAEFLSEAARHGCQALLTGEARFHACLQARELGVALILAGHYASERPAMERLSGCLSTEFAGVTIWASQREADPIRWA